MKTRANLGRITLAGLGTVLCFSDFASAADSQRPVGGAALELICSSMGELRRSKVIHLGGCLLPCGPV